MPAAVEVMVAGVRMVYPTCYVNVTDMDQDAMEAMENEAKSMKTCNNSSGKLFTAFVFLRRECSNVEPF